MMLYKIVTTTTAAELSNKVTGMLDSGWRPIGGVSAVYNGNDGMYEFFQAVMKGGQ